MVRGGKREKAGRKSSWVSGCGFEETKLIRVPAAIADRLLELAHKLDAGEAIESVTKSETTTNAQASQKSPSNTYGIACPKCGSVHLLRDGFKNGKQRYACKNCKRKFLEHLAARSLDSVTDSN